MLPPELKKEGDGWFVVFNPKATRVLDVGLVHTLKHNELVTQSSASTVPGIAKLTLHCCVLSIVHCVRFSPNGEYLATGCNHTAQIFDTKTGAKTWFGVPCCIQAYGAWALTDFRSVLPHETRSTAKDMYIRGVCFSPDGKLLATGAEDGIIRVCSMSFTPRDHR